MQILIGLLILFLFLFLGDLTSAAIGQFIPGNVIGMIYLFLALCFRIVKPQWIRAVSDFFSKNMVIFFVPLFMSLLDEWNILRLDFWAWLAILALTTVLVMLSAGGVVELASKSKGGHGDE
ncbi:MAG: CidA/LrgA family protein [Bacteroidales bacterium]|nr:CidA/LrgA family protein [Bacteroidales bacterium]